MKISNICPQNKTHRAALRAIFEIFEQSEENDKPRRTDKPHPPWDIQIHTPTTDSLANKAKGVVVYTSAGNEAAAVASVKDVLAEGETIQQVVVDSKPETAKKVTPLPEEHFLPKAEEPKPEKPKAEKPKKEKKEQAAKKPDTTEAGKKIRLLMLEACKLDGVAIVDVNNAIFEACDVTALRDIKPEQTDQAIAAVQALIDGSKGGEA